MKTYIPRPGDSVIVVGRFGERSPATVCDYSAATGCLVRRSSVLLTQYFSQETLLRFKEMLDRGDIIAYLYADGSLGWQEPGGVKIVKRRPEVRQLTFWDDPRKETLISKEER